jgi:uncharacterized membrane protein HdeD (DUF308 family)
MLSRLRPYLAPISGPYFDAALVLSVIIPYLFYAFVYFRPSSVLRYLAQDTLIRISFFFKYVTSILYIAEALRCKINWPGLAIGAPCLLVGHFLSFSVMRKLGRVRASYGWELSLFSGDRITNFPFQIGHAQYKGLILAVFGSWCMFQPTPQLTAVTAVWLAMYFFITVVESFPSGRKF